MTTLWRYIRIQLVVFVFGIVGPIFLILFFVLDSDPTMKWAYWFGLFITFADVMIALGLTQNSLDASRSGNNNAARRLVSRSDGLVRRRDT